MKVLKINGVIFISNALLFVLLFSIRPLFYYAYLITLSIVLLLSYIFYSKQKHTNENKLTLLNYNINNLSGLILMCLFSINLFLFLKELHFVEVLYMIIFIIIQFRITEINKKDIATKQD